MQRIVLIGSWLLLFILESTLSVSAKNKRLTLRNAMAKKLITVLAEGRGTTGENALKLELTSNVDDTLTIVTESGLYFKPGDSTRQPLILLGGDMFVLNAYEKKTTNVTAFCGNSSARCPLRADTYTYERQVDTNLVSILKYAKQNSVPPNLAQCAVWMFTNGHSLSSVYSPVHPIESEKFVAHIAAKMKKKIPIFYRNYRIDSSGFGAMVRRNEEKVYTNITWNGTQGYRNVYVSVYRSDGTIYKRVENNIVSDKSGSAVVVALSRPRDPAGVYFVRLHDDANNILQEKKVMIGDIPEEE